MELVDSHCHIDFEPLAERLDEVLDHARGAGVTHMLCVAVNIEDFPRVLELARRHRHIFATCGVHPNETAGEEPSVERLIELGADPGVVAIGETGLDYFRSRGDLDWQRERFRRHIEAARTLGKPLVIHSRDAPEDTVALMRTHEAGTAGGVMHCFAGDWAMAQACLDVGFYISFSGIVTFKSAQTLMDVARRVPLERLLIETDAPYLAPVPFRGKTNQPGYVRHVAEHVAELRGVSAEALGEATTANFFRLFRHAERTR